MKQKLKKTVAAVCRTMIISGKTDAQIWAVLRRDFQMDDTKKYYIAWYRAEVKRRGLTADRREFKRPVEVDRRRVKTIYKK